MLLLLEAPLELLLLRPEPLGRPLELRIGFVGLQAHLEPLFSRQLLQVALGDSRAGLELAWATGCDLVGQQLLDTLVNIVFEDALLVVQVLADGFELLPFYRQGA